MRTTVYIAASFAVLATGCLSPLVGAECADGYAPCGGSCVDTSSDPNNCGGCGITCNGTCVDGTCPDGPDDGGGIAPDSGTGDAGTSTPDAGTSTPDAGSGCGTGLQRCGNTCVDTSSDPDNCGACGVVCTSGLCTAGMCQDLTTGHVVVIGHDYLQSRAGMARLVGNAVFLAAGAPVHVLTFTGGATRASINGTNAAVDQVASELGRRWDRVDGTASTVPSLLGHAEVFLIYAQKSGTDASLMALGRDWSAALDNFLSAGGIVVLLDGPANHAGTYQILSAAGIADLSGRHAATSPTLMVTAPTDAIARAVPPAYRNEKDTVAFDVSTGTTVISDGTSPVVVHQPYY